MSARPSPLKSPVPIACQLGLGLPTLAAASTPAPLTAQMLPSPLTFWNRMSELPSPLKSLGGGHDNGRPCACHAGPGLPRSPAAITLAPLISQITTSPLAFCHRMSERPSRLKSPVALTCQSFPGSPRSALPITPNPLVSQTTTSPLTFCHTMPAWPSPLKSPVALTRQFGPGFG